MAAYDHLTTAYPYREEYLRPTRLGNAVSALETYPLDRYGIDLGALWPRLTHLIDADVRSRIDDRAMYLDFTLVMSTLSLAAAAVATVEAFQTPRALVTRIALPIAFLGLFWVFYLLSVHAARAFAVDVQAAVDVYRPCPARRAGARAPALARRGARSLEPAEDVHRAGADADISVSATCA